MSQKIIRINGYDHTKCIVCNRLIKHGKEKKFLTTIAHYYCAKIMRLLNHGTYQQFAQNCIKYDIEPTDKALYMELAVRYL